MEDCRFEGGQFSFLVAVKSKWFSLQRLDLFSTFPSIHHKEKLLGRFNCRRLGRGIDEEFHEESHSLLISEF